MQEIFSRIEDRPHWDELFETGRDVEVIDPWTIISYSGTSDPVHCTRA